jgi:hypothetical protein
LAVSSPAVTVRVVAIEALSSLSPAELRLAQRCVHWPGDDARQGELRAYWLQDGGVMVAPRNRAIEPGMEIVAVGGVAVAFEDSIGGRGDQHSLEVQCAQAVTER